MSSDFTSDPPAVGRGFGWADWPAGVAGSDFADASRDADESGIGEPTGAVASADFSAAAEEGRGAACGAGSLAGLPAGSGLAGELTDVSPVNGLRYSLCGLMTSRALGL